MPLLHFLEVSYLCLEATLAYSYFSGKRRLDFTIKTNYPAFLAKALSVGSHGAEASVGSPEPLDLGAPGTNKAKLGHSSCIIFRAELAKSPEAYIPQSLYWKLKSEFLLCFLKKIYLSVPTYLFTNSSSNFPPPQKGREKRRSHINDKVSLSKILPCEPCCKSSLAESTILHRAHLYSSLLPPPPSFLFNLSVQN